MSGETQSEARVTTEAGAYDVALGLLDLDERSVTLGCCVSPDGKNGPPCGWPRPGDFLWLIAMTRATYYSIEYYVLPALIHAMFISPAKLEYCLQQ